MRSKHAALNFIASSLRGGVGLVLGIFTTPIILKYLGEEQFGVFRILVDWFSHLTLFEFGLYGAALSFLTKIISGKKVKLGVALRTLFSQYSKVLLIQVVVVVVFAFFIDSLIFVSDEHKQSTKIAFALMSVGILFVYTQVFRAYLESSQRGFIVSYVLVIQNVVYLMLSVIFVYCSFGLVGQVAAYLLGLFFSALLYLWLCRKDLKSLLSKEILVQEDTDILKKQRKNLFLNDFFNRASFFSDNIIITFLLGAKAVTAVYLTQRLAQIFQQQLLNISYSSWPAIGDLYYKDEHHVLRQRVIQLSELTACFSGISLAALILLNKNFMYLWVGENVYSGSLTTYLACINAGFFALTSLWGWCLTAISRADLTVPVYFTQGVVNIVASFVFTYAIGFNGPLVGSFIGLGIVTFWWLGKIVAMTFGIDYILLVVHSSKSFVIPVGLAILVNQYYPMPLMKSWFSLFLSFGGVFFVIMILVYLFLITKNTKKIFFSKIKLFFTRRS